MSLNLGLIITAVAVWLGYNVPIAIKHGIQSSVSAQYNLFKTIWGRSLASWFILGIAAPMMVVADNLLGVLAGMFLSLVFIAPTVRESKIAEVLHILGANMAIILGMASILLINIHLWPIVALFAIFTGISMKIGYRHHTYWIETVGFIIIMLGLLIKELC